MSDQSKFISAFGALFPVLSNAMVVKCWQEARRLPEEHYAALYGGVLQGAIAAMETRKAEARAITASIGMEQR